MLWSGIVLMVYLTTHLANLSLALISLHAVETGRFWFLLFWRFPPLECLLLAAFLAHIGLAFRSLWRMRSYRLPLVEWLQRLLGFSIPPLLLGHVLATSGLYHLAGVDDTYLRILSEHWSGGNALILIAWLHGCIGIWRRMRLSARAYRHERLLLSAATLLPVLALLGFIIGGREVDVLQRDKPALIADVAIQQSWPDSSLVKRFVRTPDDILTTMFYAGLILTIAVILLRHSVAVRRRGVRIQYEEGLYIDALRGGTLLEMSRAAGIAHAAVCGGHGRCSTCRVRVLKGAHRLPPPAALEQRVLERIGAGDDIRLACQIRPQHDMKVARLIAADQARERVLQSTDRSFGDEREIVAMFVDIRGFTRLSEQLLPFDTIFLLNRFFAMMGHAIEQQGGHLDKFVGDGIIAFFGIQGELATAAGDALRAASLMALRLEGLNTELRTEQVEEVGLAAAAITSLIQLKIGIGLHAGTAILGEVGFGRARSLTAIGDTVNVASRLEALNKDLGTQLVVSQHVLDLAGARIAAATTREVDVRGRAGRLRVAALPDAQAVILPPPQHRRPLGGFGARRSRRS